MKLSVLICAHNPRPDYFARCVAALRQQTLPASQWDLVVVDNASSPDQAPRADFSWHPWAQQIHAPMLGLTPARLAAIREATGDLLIFVDDDNLLDPDYLETAITVAGEKPFLGSWSGQCRPEFEQPPPEWTRRYWGNLVIREFDGESWSNLPRLAETMPCGAGLCVRRSVASEYVRLHETGRRLVALDRSGESLLSGGDNDLAACACDLGFGMGLLPSLKLTHLIAPERLTQAYLARLTYGIYYSSTLLDIIRRMPNVERGAIGRMADFIRCARTPPPHREILRAAHRGRRDAQRRFAQQPAGSASARL